ncbi:MAG: cobalt-precorrin 5A hydrolase [Huintestinicola sp.]|uniref:cobalt-precorrin 5A hydrolase n=1 Tax=Huintestinicola sp. TaxID=2981661 RepID=UPI003F124B3B
MNIAVITVTENGVRLAETIREKLSSEFEVKIFCFGKYPASEGECFDSIGRLTGKIWGEFGALVFISACGIAVRAIAPFVKSKLSDPAVIAADDSGRFAVSLLSGHIGGGNRLAEIIGECIGAVPVITTATDNSGRFSPDMFAKANDLAIMDMETAKLIAAASLRGEVIGLYSDIPLKNIPKELLGKNDKYGICISHYAEKKPFDITLSLIPKNLVIGAGCRKNADPDELEKLILETLSDSGLSPLGIRFLATVDIKKDEPAIISFAKKYGAELRTFTAEELSAAEGVFSSSEFVKKTVGVDNVCERSAAACGGDIIVPKVKGNGVTCAVGVVPVSADFERRAL